MGESGIEQMFKKKLMRTLADDFVINTYTSSSVQVERNGQKHTDLMN